MCCPEGVYSNDPEGGCGCNNAKNISPYRMTELHPVIDGSSMIYTFAIDTVVPVEDPASGCNSMDLDEIRIYIDWIYVGHVTSASFNGVDKEFAYGSSGDQSWIQVLGVNAPLTPVGTVASLTLTLDTVDISVPLCGHNALGTDACEYVMYGEWNVLLLNHTCCAHGFSELTTVGGLPPEPMQCDENANHSPYYVAINTTNYDSASYTTLVELSLG